MALITKLMSSKDRAVDQNQFYLSILLSSSEYIYANEASDIRNKKSSFSAQMKKHNRYSNIINNLKHEHWTALSFFHKWELKKKSPIKVFKVNKLLTTRGIKFQNG